MPKLPQISGNRLIKLLESLGYTRVHQKGSHIKFRKTSSIGEHTLTIPKHKVLAKGTLNDILSKTSLWNNITKDDLLKKL